jgi:hypothetical protein
MSNPSNPNPNPGASNSTNSGQTHQDWKRVILTPIKEEEDGTNNFSEFKFKSTIKLRAAKLWKYIGGENYRPPTIPELVPARRIQGTDTSGNPIDIHLQGNENEVAIANRRHSSWLEGDEQTLTLITNTVPTEKAYVIEHCKTAHAAWEALCDEYEPNNSLMALDYQQQISTYACNPGDNPAHWLQTMSELYAKLRGADSSLMPDPEFAKMLITHMSKDEKWRYCRNELRSMLATAQRTGKPLSSATVITCLKSEEIDKRIAPAVKAMNLLVKSGKGKKQIYLFRIRHCSECLCHRRIRSS